MVDSKESVSSSALCVGDVTSLSGTGVGSEQKSVAATGEGVGTETKKSPLRKDTISQIQRVIGRITQVLRIFGYSAEGEKLGGTVSHWMAMVADTAGVDAWVKVTKYKLAALYSHWMGQPLPMKPFRIDDNPAILLGGAAYRWMHGRLIRGGDEADELLFSLKMVKKALPRPSKAFLDQAEREAFVKLTTPVRGPLGTTFHKHAKTDTCGRRCVSCAEGVERKVEWTPPRGKFLLKWADIEEGAPAAVISREVVVAELRRTVREIYGKTRFTLRDRFQPCFPSTSANYIDSRSGGGAVGTLLGEECVLSGLREPGFSGFDVHPARRLGLAEFGEGGVSVPEVQSADDSYLRLRYRKYYYRLLREAEREEPLAKPVALAEALKARVITKGPPYLMTVLKPVQRKLWKVLADHPCFRLVGQPLDEWILQERLGNHLGPREGYLSGDYSDATNELHSWVSDAIVDEICDVWQVMPLERDLFRRALTGHIIDYGGEQSRQQRGQLMGSVVSFPILCIANAAMCRWVWEQTYGMRTSLERFPGCFNGDDVVFRTTKEGREMWRQALGFVGLTESVGKTYFSSSFLEMNSRMYRVSPHLAFQGVEGGCANPIPGLGGRVRESRFKAVGFVNLGLVYGLKRSGTERVGAEDVARSEGAYQPSAGARAQDLVETSPERLRDRVMREYIRQNRLWLDQVRVPWYMPRWLGGVGLPSWFRENGTLVGPTSLDLRKAKSIMLNWSRNRPRLSTDAEWRMHQLALKRLPAPHVAPASAVTRDMLAASDRLYGDSIIGLLFDSDVGIDRLKVAKGESRMGAKRALRWNERLWTKAAPLGRPDVSKILSPPGLDRPVEYWPAEFADERIPGYQAHGLAELEMVLSG